MAVAVVTILTLCLTLFAFQSKYDFTLLFSLVAVIMFVLCVFAVFLFAFPSRKIYFVYCGLIVLVFSVSRPTGISRVTVLRLKNPAGGMLACQHFSGLKYPCMVIYIHVEKSIHLKILEWTSLVHGYSIDM